MNPLSKEEWEAALCKVHPEISWFPEKKDREGIKAAKQVCLSCPIRLECLVFAYVNQERFGIWGGKNAEDIPLYMALIVKVNRYATTPVIVQETYNVVYLRASNLDSS